MREKLFRILLLTTCLCLSLITLTGCNDNKSTFVGTWQAESVEFENGDIYNIDEQYKKYANGDIIYLETGLIKYADGTEDHTYNIPDFKNITQSIKLNQDGSGSIKTDLATYEITWVADSATKITLTRSLEMFGIVQDSTFTLTDGKLVGGQTDSQTITTLTKE